MKPKTIVVTILIFLMLILLVQNTQVVTVKLFFWDVSMSRIILIFFLLLIGFILGYFAAKLRKRG